MIITNCNADKLHTEFNVAGIHPWPVFDNGDGSAEMTFPEGTDMDLVQTIIDDHNPTPLPQSPTAEERIVLVQHAIDFILMNF